MEVHVVIEDPRGSTVRHHWDDQQARWVTKPHPFSSEPWPASYGYIPGTWNPTDDDDLDVLVLSRDPLDTGTEARVRAVGLLRRPDGDDKILGVVVDDPDYGSIQRFNDVPADQIAAIEQWFRTWSDVGKWDDERAAVEQIDHARRYAR